MRHPRIRKSAAAVAVLLLIVGGSILPLHADETPEPPPPEENQAEEEGEGWLEAVIEALQDLILPDTGAKIEGDGSS